MTWYRFSVDRKATSEQKKRLPYVTVWEILALTVLGYNINEIKGNQVNVDPSISDGDLYTLCRSVDYPLRISEVVT